MSYVTETLPDNHDLRQMSCRKSSGEANVTLKHEDGTEETVVKWSLRHYQLRHAGYKEVENACNQYKALEKKRNIRGSSKMVTLRHEDGSEETVVEWLLRHYELRHLGYKEVEDGELLK